MYILIHKRIHVCIYVCVYCDRRAGGGPRVQGKSLGCTKKGNRSAAAPKRLRPLSSVSLDH